MAVTVDCPTCGEKVEWVEKNTFRPFCSLRCKHNDLSAWATEQYVIPVTATADELDESEANHHNLSSK